MMADVDARLFDQVADRFHIQKFRFAEARPAGPAIPVRIANGAVAGHFTWDEANFGGDFAAASSPYILAVFTGLGLFTLLTVHEGLRLTNSLKRTLVAQAEAQAASREKDKFLKVMSHELRTPLNAVIGFSEIMSNEMLGPHGVPAYKDYSAQIHNSGTHLLNIFNDILTLIKLESGDFQVDCARLDATEVAKEAIEELVPHSQAAAVDVVLEPSDDAYVVADRKALRRVLVAVVGNAIKFSNAKSTVEVIFTARPQNLVEIGVRDRGIGMSADQVAVAGLPFHQVEGPLARRNGGTGVGLALTRGFVGLMEGRIQIESAEGEGTLVRLLLPAAA
jgi:two-component system cell cycle sensor histidine kinase PleC